jgi:hypothetical protein
MQYPDSPEGVAFALMMFIVGGVQPPDHRMSECETLALYRRCLASVQGCAHSAANDGVLMVH